MAITVLALYNSEAQAEKATAALKDGGLRREKAAVISASNQDELTNALTKRGLGAEIASPYAAHIAAGQVLVAVQIDADYGPLASGILYSNDATEIKRFANT